MFCLVRKRNSLSKTWSEKCSEKAIDAESISDETASLFHVSIIIRYLLFFPYF